MTAEMQQEITFMVRSGFYRKEELLNILSERHQDGAEQGAQFNRDETQTAINASWAMQLAAQKNWPEETDCDRLDRVFDSLNQRGIVALQNVGYTQSDGYSDVREAYSGREDQTKIFGYCFYHGQDLERAVEGEGLNLAFGPIDPEKEETEGPAVGMVVANELEKEGFDVQWDGTFDERILIPHIDWKRRISNE